MNNPIVASVRICGFLFIFTAAIVLAGQNNPQNPPRQSENPQASGQTDTPKEKWEEMLEEKHNEFFAWLEKNYPEKANKLKKIGNEKPDEFASKLGSYLEIYGPIQNAERYSPELAQVLKDDLELKSKRDRLLVKMHSAKEEQRKALLHELQEVVSTRFDLIIKRKQLEYDNIRNRLEWLSKRLEDNGKELQKLKDEKDQSVEKRMQELIEGKVEVDW